MPDIAPATAPMIVFEHVSKRYGAAADVIDDLSFTVARGEFVLLTGPSGAGKSTALRLISALETPNAGKVVVGDVDLARLKARARATLRRTMGIVPQDLMLLPDRTALDNVMLPALTAGLSLRDARTRANAALIRVGVEEASAFPPALSGGLQQRVALARAIVNRPALLLADEPTAHLDEAAAADIVRLLDEFAASGVTVVLASHGESVALPATARTVRLAKARVSS